jgi:quercetin dioxygenase-like cupin family protein
VARAGDTIEYPAARGRGTFLRTTADSGGEALEMEFVFEPGGSRLPPHIHRLQDETFELLEGTVRFGVRGEFLERAPGERLTVPHGASHSLCIIGDVTARFRVEFRPALDLEGFFKALYGLGAAGKVNRFGLPGPIWIATLMWTFPKEFFYLPVLPWWLQRSVLAPLALIGRLVGYRTADAQSTWGARPTT